jgi:hypothetical protein
MEDFMRDRESNKVGGRFVLAIGVIIAVMFLLGYRDRNKLSESHNITEAKITGCYWDNGRSSASYYILNYRFIVSGWEYTNFLTVPCKALGGDLQSVSIFRFCLTSKPILNE